MNKLRQGYFATLVLLTIQAAPVQAADDTIWITDDTAKMVYQVSADGSELLFGFNNPRPRDYSEIAVDPFDNTLWITSEAGSAPGVIFNTDRSGNVLTEFEFGFTPEGIVVDPTDGTLWIPDDFDLMVYNIRRDGIIISTFSTAAYDPAAESPQGISLDPGTDTLWITDNSSNRVYNVEKNGALISSFRANDIDPTFGGTFFNVQGISFDSVTQTLWISSRTTGKVCNATTSGQPILCFPTSGFAPESLKPTGVAIDRAPAVELGDAEFFAVLALPGAKLKMNNIDKWTGVVGDVGLGPNAEQDFDEGLLTGTFRVDPNGDNDNDNKVVILGGTVDADLTGAVQDAMTASSVAGALAPDQLFGDIKDSVSIVGGPGINVIRAKKIELDDRESLTLIGDPSSRFIVNLTEKFKLKKFSTIELYGGVLGRNVFFNILGDGDSEIEGGSTAFGTILAPLAVMKIKGQGTLLVGSILGGNEIKLEDGGRVRVTAAMLPPGNLGAAGTGAVEALPGAKIKLSGSSSTIIGDVLLGPAAKQDFSSGLIQGTYVVDPASDIDHDNNVVITGGTVSALLSRAAADAVDASTLTGRLTADQEFDDIDNTFSIVGGPGRNVIQADKIELDNGEVLTLVGQPSSTFVFNLDKKLKLTDQSAIVLVGGVLPENVLYNVLGGDDSSIESNSVARGTLLAPRAGKVKIKNTGAKLIGAVISGGEIIVENGGTIDGGS